MLVYNFYSYLEVVCTELVDGKCHGISDRKTKKGAGINKYFWKYIIYTLSYFYSTAKIYFLQVKNTY